MSDQFPTKILEMSMDPRPAPVSVLVVDDHHVVRVGLCAVLRDNPQLRVVGDAATAAEAVSKCSELHPDVVLMDIRMPDGSGIHACRKIKEHDPKVRILFLTSYSDSSTLGEALGAGADGYLLKSVNGENIADCVEKVGRGAAIVDPTLTRQLLALASPHAHPDSDSTPNYQLTGRDDRVLAMVSVGRTNKEIATSLNLSEKTVRNLLSAVYKKLGASTRKEAANRWSASRSEATKFA